MAISSVVITLAQGAQEKVLETIARDPRVELGEPCGLRVPAVIEAPGGLASRDVWHWLQDLEGVVQVSLATVYHDELVDAGDGETI